jgi:hypothetical protein
MILEAIGVAAAVALVAAWVFFDAFWFLEAPPKKDKKFKDKKIRRIDWDIKRKSSVEL